MNVAEFPYQVHPNRSDQTQALGCRISDLTDLQRLILLYWLSGYDPDAVQRAITRWIDEDQP